MIDARALALSMAEKNPAGSRAMLRQLGLPPGQPSPPAAKPRGMNGWEESYAAHLSLRQAAGEVAWFGFEMIRLLITKPGGRKRAYYKPDFFVVMPDGRCEIHEVKGHWREAAKLRAKLVADIYPWPVLVCRRTTGGTWVTEAL